ncbi:hypothetical protein ACOSQ4_014143 [Xanthoceras sorbifolium]
MAKVYSHFTEHIVEYSDSEDHTSRVKYSSLEPSFLDREPSVKNDPICSWKMHETKSSVATAQMGMGRISITLVSTINQHIQSINKFIQFTSQIVKFIFTYITLITRNPGCYRVDVPKTTTTRFKTLGHKLRVTYIGPRTRRQTSERIFTIPIKVAVILGVSTVGKIF